MCAVRAHAGDAPSDPTCCLAACLFFKGSAQNALPAEQLSGCYQVWDEGGNGYVRYSAATVGLQHMGYVAENTVLQAALAHRLKQPGGRTSLVWPVQNTCLPPLQHFSLQVMYLS